MIGSQSKFAGGRRGFSYRGLLIALVVLTALPAIGWSLWPGLGRSGPDSGPMMCQVERAEFIHEITDRGNLESASNVEIKCEVKSQGTAGTQILEIIPEGTYVQPGDVLAKLDSSVLEDDRTRQLIVCSNSEAALIQARNVYLTAVIAKEEYLQGVYEQTKQGITAEITVADENLRRAEDYARFSERLADRGYVTKLQLEADKFAVKKAGIDMGVAKQKLAVLDEFTKKKMAIQLDSDIKTAEAKLKAAEATHQLDLERLKLVEGQIEKCIIKAPEAGQVVYANVTGYRGTKEVLIAPGEMARERQVLIRLPDPKRMQVVAKIAEGKIALVQPEMPATIHLDAFPDLELEGAVDKVDEFPVPTSYFSSSVKEYQTLVRINGSPPGLRPGLTAEVKIRVEQLPDVLQMPVQSVFEHGGKYYCVIPAGRRFKVQEVQIRSTNDKVVVVRGGLQEGQQVVLNAAAYRDKLELPELPAENGHLASRGAQRRAGSAEANGSRPAEAQPAPAALGPAEIAKGIFAQFDKNRDGLLALSDLPADMRSRLQSADTNHDGMIDLAELTAAVTSAPRRAEGGPPNSKAAP
jgi:multidrug resistance efflux pump